MRNNFKKICMVVLVLMCTVFFGVICHADTDNSGFEWFADESSYTEHYHGIFGGVEVLSENSVRVLAKISKYGVGNTGFMLKKNVIAEMVNEGYKTVSFKVTTEGYEANPTPAYVNVYASGINAAIYHNDIHNGIRVGNEDIYYAIGSVVTIDLVKLMNEADFSDGLKFILNMEADFQNPLGAPAYLVMSDFKFTKQTDIDGETLKLVDIFDDEASYTSHYYG